MMTNETNPADGASQDVPAPTPADAAAPARAATTSPWVLRTDVALLLMVLTLSFFLGSFAATNSDLWLHLAVGKRISAGQYEIGVDPYSWATEAFGDAPAVYWVNHNWLYSWLLFQTFQLIGGAGLVIGKAIAFTATIALLSRIGWHSENRWFVLLCLALGALAASGRVFLQPMALSYFFLAVTMYVLYRAGAFALKHEGAAAGNPRCLWALPPLFVLWVNLDSWFFLGLLLIALCWAATGLAKWFREGGLAPGKTLGLVFAASLLACLANPHHVRVFQMPPELAYVALSLVEPFGLPLPEDLVAGGRTIRELRKADFTLPLDSALSMRYWGNNNLGLNIAALAAPALLLLGLGGFGLMALVRPQPNAPRLQISRFLLWLIFAVLGLAMYRLIPFFALIAAPLTAMTLEEFLSWQQTTGAVASGSRERSLRLARFVSVPFFVLLLFLAWPGWLSGPNDYNAARRVCWELRPDPSAVRVAETLRELKERGECRNVFNANFDVGNYLPWYAPGVKHFMDVRYNLFAKTTPRYAKARKALRDDNEPSDDWRDLFLERDIDQVAVFDVVREGQIFKWWFDPIQWRQRCGDARILLFSWKDRQTGGWPGDTARADWNRQAFGSVEPARRPPENGAPRTPLPTPWTLYLDGTGAQPGDVAQAEAAHLYFQAMRGRTQILRGVSFQTFFSSLTALQASPGGGMTLAPATAGLLFQWTFFNSGVMILPNDLGPPAAPVLMVRAARRAVAENPLNIPSHFALLKANELLRNDQEDYWANLRLWQGRPQPSVLRDRMREFQLLSGAYQLAQLQPDAPENHMRLVAGYMQQSLFDLALEHWHLARKGFENRLASASGPKAPTEKEKEALLRQVNVHPSQLEALERSIRLRRADLRDKTAKYTPLQKADYALHADYEEIGAQVRRSPLGLGKDALELLGAVDPKNLDAKEIEPYLRLRFELLLKTGQADVVAQDLKDESVRKVLQPAEFANFQLLAGAALGDYAAMDQALGVIEESLRTNVKTLGEEIHKRREPYAGLIFHLGTRQSARGLMVAGIAQLVSPPYVELNIFFQQREQFKNGLYNAIALRGIAALEAGETAKARAFFQRSLDEAGADFPFGDRPIAGRYLDLLDEQKR